MSNKVVFFRQTRMRRTIPGGHCEQMSWIAEQYAVPGKVLKLRDDDGVWEDGWVVVGAGNRLAQADVPDYHQLIKGHLRATGDAEPKKAKAAK